MGSGFRIIQEGSGFRCEPELWGVREENQSMATELIQIYWSNEQLLNLYPFATPYKNEILTPFFENAVIAHLVPLSTKDKIGICSPNLRQKIGGGIPLREPFTEKSIEGDYEVLSLCRRQPDMKMLWRLDHWHPGSLAILLKIWHKIGKSAPNEPKNPIFQNHFIAKTSIYQDYVSDFLIPAMKVMEEDEEIRNLCWQDSNYYKLKLDSSQYSHEWRLRVKKFLGVDYVPLHTFILERCFSCWINTRPIKITYL